ncbi:TrkH family potassium uptake protein [Haliangium ochraceum]|uniref:Cation transporter n=1 Tax=Haliangium ochraceum (strain DSM 14365 / JCM 11303 / SMP-2) TaxID=502025 RepID=D0LVM2_HALO1|nr:TrkH family potassium uptake protein [Haliangium ochraceum]ACY17583.1 cation transporter [Haliangium ochraceum DSM 14365]
MRAGVLQRITSRLLGFAVFSLVVPMLVGLLAGDGVWWAFAIPAVFGAMASYGFARLPAAREASTSTLRRREGFVAVCLGWSVLVLLAAVAFSLTGAFPGFAEAFFESMSGFTTTGASVITNIEGLPASVLFMRSFSHWIGGMGIIVLSVAILPELGVGGMQLFSAESSGIESDKLAPRIAATSRRLWSIYVAITAVQALLLLVGGMSFFDAINHAMSTIGTGGFSTKNSSVASFDSLYAEMVILVFMFISGISFTLQFRAVLDLRAGRLPSKLLGSPEVRLYTFVTLGATAVVTLSLLFGNIYETVGESLRYASFQVVSIITTTGFGTADFALWPPATQLLLVILMLIGGCAGSTAGGFKYVRLYMVAQHARIQMRRLIRPRLVQTMHLGRREISHETTESVLGYSLLYTGALLVGSLGMTLLGMDLISGTTAAVSALNSIGPGLGSVGPAQNFGHVHDLGLYLLSIGMLLGRLEIYPVLVLFTAHFWRRG